MTEFEFARHDVGPTVLAGVLISPFEVARELLRFHRSFTATSPDELCCYASIRTTPTASSVPEEVHGERIATMYLCYHGDRETGERAIQPLRSFATPIVDLVEPRRYVVFRGMFDDVYLPGFRNYWKSQFVAEDGLSDAAMETMVDHAATVTSPLTSIVVEHLGGEISRRDPTTMAYPPRRRVRLQRLHAVGGSRRGRPSYRVDAGVPFGDRPCVDTGRLRELPRSRGRIPGSRRVWGNYDRLVDAKHRYGPENLFRMNHNIKPTV